MSVATGLSNLISNLKLIFIITIPATWQIMKALNKYYRSSKNRTTPVQIIVGAPQAGSSETWNVQLMTDERIRTVLKPQRTATTDQALHKPAFGFMKNTGSIDGDILSPVVPEQTWDVLG